MTIEEAYELIENRDYAEGLKRKFAPGFSLIHVNRDRQVLSVLRFKKLPTEQEQLDAIVENRGCIQLSANPGMYSSASELRERIEGSMWLFDKMKPATT
jgi:hypothetical protein